MKFLAVCIMTGLLLSLGACTPQRGAQYSRTSSVKPAVYPGDEVKAQEDSVLRYPSEIRALLLRSGRTKDGISVATAERCGRLWGAFMKEIGSRQGDDMVKIDVEAEPYLPFTLFLLGTDVDVENRFDFFSLPREVKKGFQLGFRQGYEERNGDFIFALNMIEATRKKASMAAENLMKVYRQKIIADIIYTNRFKDQWQEEMVSALKTFEGLTADGSPAEAAAFLSAFPMEYEKELNNLITCLNGYTRCDLKPAEVFPETNLSSDDIYAMIGEEDELKFSESSEKILGTTMDYAVIQYQVNNQDNGINSYYKYSSKKKENQESRLLLTDSTVKSSVLHGEGLVEQLNKVSWLFIGQEMGRKYNHRLVSLDEVLEWLRKSRSIMESQSVEGFYDTSIRLLRDGFQLGYGPGGEKEWQRLAEEIRLDI